MPNDKGLDRNAARAARKDQRRTAQLNKVEERLASEAQFYWDEVARAGKGQRLSESQLRSREKELFTRQGVKA